MVRHYAPGESGHFAFTSEGMDLMPKIIGHIIEGWGKRVRVYKKGFSEQLDGKCQKRSHTESHPICHIEYGRHSDAKIPVSRNLHPSYRKLIFLAYRRKSCRFDHGYNSLSV